MTPDFPPGTRVRVRTSAPSVNGRAGTVRAEDEGFDNPGMASVELDDGQVGLFWPEMLERIDGAAPDLGALYRAAFPMSEHVAAAARAGHLAPITDRFDVARQLAPALPAPEHVQAAARAAYPAVTGRMRAAADRMRRTAHTSRPETALLVADWLDSAANDAEEIGPDFRAERVAAAILGEPDPHPTAPAPARPATRTGDATT